MPKFYIEIRNKIFLLIFVFALFSLIAGTSPIKRTYRVASTPMDFWKIDLGKKLEKDWVYHPKFEQLNPKLKTHILFKVQNSGHIEYIKIATKSGNSFLDNAALNTVKNAAPFKKLPEGMESYELIVVFSPKGLK